MFIKIINMPFLIKANSSQSNIPSKTQFFMVSILSFGSSTHKSMLSQFYYILASGIIIKLNIKFLCL